MPEVPAARRSGRLRAWLALWAALTALEWAGRLVKQPHHRVPEFFRYELGVGGLVQYGILLGVLLLIGRGLPLREAFALRRPRSWARAAPIAAGVVVVVLLLEAVVARFANPSRDQAILPSHWVPGHAGAFVVSVIAVAIAAPVVEELMFRGLGFRLLAHLGEWRSIALVGLFFGLAHGIPSALPILVPFGAGLAYLRARTRSVYPSIVLHASFNAATIAYVFA